MFLTILPISFKYFSASKKECSLSMFHALWILSFIPVSIRPSKNSESLYQAIFPFPLVLPIINISKCSLPMKVAIYKSALINSGVADIMSETTFNSMKKISFVVGAIQKFLFCFSMWSVFMPLAVILIALKRIIIGAGTISLIIFNFSLINAAIIVKISSLPMSDSLFKSTLEICSILKKNLSFSMILVAWPLSVIICLKASDLLISIAINTL